MTPLRLLFSLIAACAICRAGVEQDFPEFFPKADVIPEAENGWPLLVKLPKVPRDDLKELLPISAFTQDALRKLDADRVRRILRVNREFLEKLEAAMSRPAMLSDSWKTFSVLQEDPLSTIEAMMGVRLLLSGAVIEIRTRPCTSADLRVPVRVMQFGERICNAYPLLADGLFGLGIIKMGAGTVAAMGLTADASPEFVKEATDTLDRFDHVPALMRKAYIGEIRWTLRFHDDLIKGGAARRGKIIEWASVRQMWDEIMGKVPKTGADGASATAQEISDAWQSKVPDWVAAAIKGADEVDWRANTRDIAGETRAVLAADASSLVAFRKSFNPPKQTASLKGTPLEVLENEDLDMKTEDTFIRSVCNGTAAIRLARTQLLLRLFERKNGKLPEALEQLVPEFCNAVPLDPYDGKPLRYDAGARKAWCVGFNLKDDGGISDAEKDGKDDQSVTMP